MTGDQIIAKLRDERPEMFDPPSVDLHASNRVHLMSIKVESIIEYTLEQVAPSATTDVPQPAFAEILGKHYDPGYEYRVRPTETNKSGWSIPILDTDNEVRWVSDLNPSKGYHFRRRLRPPAAPPVQTPEEAAKLHAGTRAVYDEPYVITEMVPWLECKEIGARNWTPIKNDDGGPCYYAVPLRLVPPEQRGRYAVCVQGDGGWVPGTMSAAFIDGSGRVSVSHLGGVSKHGVLYFLEHQWPPEVTRPMWEVEA